MRKPKNMTRALTEREKEMLKNAFGEPRFELFEAYQNGKEDVEYICIKKGVPIELTIWNVKKMMRALKKFAKKENLMFQVWGEQNTWLSEIEGITKEHIINLDGCGIRTFQELRDVICYDKEWLPIVLRSHKSARKLIKIFKEHVGAAIYE